MENQTPPPQPESLGRILVVDDNRDNVEIIATRLRFRGYEIDEASDGAQAIASVHANAPDLILLDVLLPDIDVYEISRRLKGDDKLPFIPIILVTARDTTQDRAAAELPRQPRVPPGRLSRPHRVRRGRVGNGDRDQLRELRTGPVPLSIRDCDLRQAMTA